jgi:hypothetical protein
VIAAPVFGAGGQRERSARAVGAGGWRGEAARAVGAARRTSTALDAWLDFSRSSERQPIPHLTSAPQETV